jgi:hypothetical protein
MMCKAADAWGRMNAFQRVMYQWSGLHPYNATHTYKIAGPLELDRLRSAVRETCRFNGLGIVCVAPDGQSYRHEVDHAPDVDILMGDDHPENRLTEHLTRELNRPFARPICRPLRFSAIAAGPDYHYVSATYDHWVADSVAARLIVRHVLGRYCKLDIPENNQPLNLYPGTYREVFAHRLHGLRLAAAATHTLCQWPAIRAAAQPAYSSVAQMAVHHELYAPSPGTVHRLKALAQSAGATVHDVILAALGRAMARFLPRRSSRSKPRDLALGTIVDTRGDSQEDLSQSLGAFLAYFVVRCQPSQHGNLAEVTRHIAAMTGPIKARHRYLDSLVNMKVAQTLWPWFSETARPYFARRALPMTGGVSNVLLRDPWIEQHRDRILGYSRAASTGPALPLVLTPTTLGEQMNVGVTYRVTGFSQAKIDGIMEMFLEQIEQPQPRSLRPPRCLAVPCGRASRHTAQAIESPA